MHAHPNRGFYCSTSQDRGVAPLQDRYNDPTIEITDIEKLGNSKLT